MAACPACGAPGPGAPSVRFEGVPVLLNVLVAEQAAALAAPRGALALCACDGCGFVWNAAFQGVPYDARYQVDQSLSPRFAAHLCEVAARVAGLVGPGAPLSVVEVGCGQGVFLGVLRRHLGARLVAAHGFDPAFRGGAGVLPPGARVTAAVLDGASAAELSFAPDVVVLRHIIEHVPAPAEFLRSIRATLAPRGPFTIVIETPDADWTLGRGLLHDFCYEHCSLHSGPALAAALDRAGFGAARVERVFAGEYLLVTASSEPATDAVEPAGVTLARRGAGASLRALGGIFVEAHRARLALDRARGPVAVWGGAGKGALFVLMVDPERQLVDVVIDIHPAKAGSFLPGAGHPVVTPTQARALGVRTIVVANGNYLAEISTYCREAGWDVSLWAVGGPDAGTDSER